MLLYHVNVTLHVLAAMLWLGGMFFLAAVGAPVLRRVEPASLRAELFRSIGEQFRRVGWAAIAVLIATGALNLHLRGVLHLDVLQNVGFWRSPYGVSLAVKLATVAIMVSISAFHDFIHGPRAGRLAPGTPAALAMRTRAAWMARLNAVVGIVLVISAVRLARGG